MKIIYRLIALWEIGTGVFFIVRTSLSLLLPAPRLPDFWTAANLLLFAASTAAGIFLWLILPAGLNLSVFIQFLQIPKVVFQGVVYQLGAMFAIPVGLTLTSPKTGETIGLYANVVALAILLLLLLAGWIADVRAKKNQDEKQRVWTARG
jgi:hypothetical protein